MLIISTVINWIILKFKIITDNNTFYFAVQGPKLLRLTLTEELYSAYVDGFYSARQ